MKKEIETIEAVENEALVESTSSVEKGSNIEDAGEISKFVSSDSNRIKAVEKSVALYMMLTSGAPIEESETRKFTTTEVVKKTTLSHSEIASLLQLFRVFGIIEYTKGTHEFIIHFDAERQHQTIETEILSLCQSIKLDLFRYFTSIESDTSLSVEKRNKMVEEMRFKVDNTIW